jgi:hypothetical protein
VAARYLALGPTRVAVPGAPVQISAPVGTALSDRPTCHACIIEALPENTGKIYIGLSGLNKTTRANVLLILPVPTANVLPSFSSAMAQAANAINLTDFWIDADQPTDGVLVSALVA